MKSLWHTKKVIIALILLLISCDVSLLFAAETGLDTTSVQQQQLEQVQQLSSQPPQQPLQGTQLAANQDQGFGSVPPSNLQQAQATTLSAPPPGLAAPPNVQGTMPGLQQPNPQQQFAPQPVAAPAPTLPPPTGSASAPGTVSEDEINNQAFEDLTKTTLPMTPQQIQRLRQLFNQTQFAAAAYPGVPPRPLITSQFVNLAPGTTPPVVRLEQGMVSVLGFIDGTGAPWPIEAYDIGNPAAFSIQWNKSDNTLIIQPLTLYTYGNLAIKLQGLSTPIMLMLIPGQKVFDGRLDLHIPLYGPNALPIQTGTGLPNSADPDLLGVLDGVAPAGSIVLQVTGGPCQAWVIGNRLFVRTRLTLLSPAWLATMSSADGTKAYEIPKPTAQTPTLLVSENGKVIQLKIEGL